MSSSEPSSARSSFASQELTEARTRRTVRLEGTDVHYHDVGTGEPLLMFQAFGPLPGTTAWLTYHKMVDSAARRYRCILVDYPNFGRSSPIVFDEPVHDLYVRQAVGLIDHLELSTVRVVGMSTGGTVAIDLALQMPERVTGMVIGACEASTGGDPPLGSAWPSEAWRLFTDCQDHPPDRDRIGRLLHALVYDASLIDDALVEAMYQLRVTEPEHSAAWARSRSVPRSNLASLAGIEIPTLIVHGRHDRMVPVETALRLQARLPAADVVVLDRCGHWVPFERPHTFAELVFAFLDRAGVADQ